MKAVVFLLMFSSTNLFAEIYRCHGTEPFWGIDLDTSKIIFTTTANDLSVKRFVGAIEGVKTTGFIVDGRVIGRTLCNDGMSDREYPFEVFLSTSKLAVTGCCELRAE